VAAGFEPPAGASREESRYTAPPEAEAAAIAMAAPIRIVRPREGLPPSARGGSPGGRPAPGPYPVGAPPGPVRYSYGPDGGPDCV